MDIYKLKRTFKKIMEDGKMDYAITNTDKYGDCNSCVNYSLCRQYGEDSKGIYVREWFKGMNKYFNSWKEVEKVYIAHDITEEQGELLIKVMEENGYYILPKKYDSSQCFLISENEFSEKILASYK